jgi:hypothetical protein
VTVRAWKGLHQKLTRTGRWADWPADERLPIVGGTVIQIVVDRLPDGRKPTKDLWLWHAGPLQTDTTLVDLLWKAYLRRFDQEHFHRFAKVYLGMARAHLTSALATDRWLHLILAAYAQLRLASPMSMTCAALAAKPRTRKSAQPIPGAARPSPSPRKTGNTRRLTETHPPRPRTPQRIKEPAEGQAPALPQDRNRQQRTPRVTLNRKLRLKARPWSHLS